MPGHTQYRFPRLPELGQITVDGVPAVENQWYNRDLIANYTKENSYDYGYNYTTFDYQTRNATEISNISTITVNIETEDISPLSSSVSDLIDNAETYNFKDLMPINNGVDRVKILDFDNRGQIVSNGNPVYKNQIIERKNIANTNYISPETGSKKPIQTIKYQIGNKDGFNPTIYDIALSIENASELILISEETSENEFISPNIHTYKAVLEIQKGYVNTLANLSFSTTLGSGLFVGPTNNRIVINDIEQQSEASFDFEVLIPNNGIAKIFVLLDIEETDLPINEDITITLNDIDGDPSKVSGTNSVTLNINL